MELRRVVLMTVSSVALVVAGVSAASAQTPTIPTVEGPIAEQWGNRMHPGIFFSGNRPYLAEFPPLYQPAYHDYLEEEFFVTGTAGGQPYHTRVVVRRPADIANWSGFTMLEVQHTAGAAQTWMSSRIGAMMNGHAFVEIVDNTGAVTNLQNLNTARYADIVISNDETATQNELIAQIAYLLRTAHPSGEAWNATVLGITGSSQTSTAAMEYMEQGQPIYRMPDGAPLFDGMYVYSTNGPTAQEIAELYTVPVIVMPTEDEWDEEWTADDVATIPPDTDRYRLYQVAGMPHLEGRHYFAADPAACDLPVDHYMFSPMVFLGVQHLYNWVANDVAPPNADRIRFEADGTIVRDQFGNATGGIRTPQLDVPTHTWTSANTGSVRQCELGGTTVPLADAQLRQLYSSPADYANQLSRRTQALIEAGWFPAEYLFEIQDEVRRFGPKVGVGAAEAAAAD